MEYKEYRDEINHIFSHYTKRGFVSYYDCRGLGNDMISLLTEATVDLGRHGLYKELFDLANKAFLKWGKTDKDDSDGETQDFVAYVFEAWDAVYDFGDESVSHAKMLDWFMKHMDGSVIDYMEDEMYRYVMEHFDEEELLAKKKDFFEAQIEEKNASGDRFQIEYHIPTLKLHVMKLMGELGHPIEEIRSYASTIRSYRTKETLAEIELAYGNTERAIAIYEELADRADERWGKNEYREMLMKIYKDNGEQDKYFDALKKAMSKAIGDKELWKEYKSNFQKEDWPDACEDIFCRFNPGDSRANTWYAEEKRFDLIMAGIEVYNSTDQLKTYEKSLKKLYPDRCLAVLTAAADTMAEESKNRQDYRKLAGMLRWIQRYPDGDDIAYKLAQQYREKYPRRKAMLEELAIF